VEEPVKPSTASAKQPVRVTILSRSYTLRTSGDPHEVESLAASVDELMLGIAAKAPNADSTHIAVLACLHLADSLRQTEKELGELKQQIGQKSQRFAGLLDQLLTSADPATGD
jgi:cell division protein ZapA (FtsZ GTPase activity inhibitor)